MWAAALVDRYGNLHAEQFSTRNERDQWVFRFIREAANELGVRVGKGSAQEVQDRLARKHETWPIQLRMIEPGA